MKWMQRRKGTHRVAAFRRQPPLNEGAKVSALLFGKLKLAGQAWCGPRSIWSKNTGAVLIFCVKIWKEKSRIFRLV